MTELWPRWLAWPGRCCGRPHAKAMGAAPPDSGIGADAPIRTAAEDRLKRGDFASRIADVLSQISPREGRVFAIRGGWGFGKSSLKNLITEKLDAKADGADWVDFNPWQWSEGDAIASALFGQIADRLGGEHSKAALGRAETFRRYGAILTGAAAPLREAGGSSQTISAVLTNASVVTIAAAIGFHLPATVATVAFVFVIASAVMFLLGRILEHFGRDRRGEPLDKVREDLEARLRELARPLVVFVDDMDRLDPEQIQMLLRQVKANANLPNIVFVLLFQSSIVEKALDPIADNKGRAFLEKIVQASFDLPKVPMSVVHTIFGEELSELAGAYATEVNGFSQQRWGNTFGFCIQPMLRNLRDVRRLMSSIAMHLPLHVSSGGLFEVNIVDFLILETLRTFEPELHEALFKEKDLVLQKLRIDSNSRRDADKEAAEQLIAIASSEHRDVAKATIKNLFPSLGWAFGGVTYTEESRASWLEEKRVCAPRYFPRYFQLQTPDGEISERRFMDILEATATADGLAAAISAIEADGLLPTLAARFAESIGRLPVENAAVLLPALFGIAQKLAALRSDDPFNTPWISAWQSTLWYLKRVPQGARGDLALQALRQTAGLSIGAILIDLNNPAERNQADAADFQPVLDLATIEAMKTEWLRLMRNRAAKAGELIAEPDLMYQLYRWKAFADSLDEVRDWVATAIQTDEGFASMAERMMSRGTRQVIGDLVSTPHLSFDRSTVTDFIGLDVAKAKCDAIDPAAFPKHADALRVLRQSLELWLGLRERDPFEFP